MKEKLQTESECPVKHKEHENEKQFVSNTEDQEILCLLFFPLTELTDFIIKKTILWFLEKTRVMPGFNPEKRQILTQISVEAHKGTE